MPEWDEITRGAIMKRSRRVVLTMMGTAAVGAVSAGSRRGQIAVPALTAWARTAGPIAARCPGGFGGAAISPARPRPCAWRRLAGQMRRIACPERDDWRATAETAGFDFHTIDGERYWDERAYYAFTLDEIERQIEAPTGEIDAMCLELVGRAIDDEAIPAAAEDTGSVLAADPRKLASRRASSMAGSISVSAAAGPAKLLEYNADTPTSIFEAAVFQWTWLEQAIERHIIPSAPTSSTRSMSG